MQTQEIIEDVKNGFSDVRKPGWGGGDVLWPIPQNQILGFLRDRDFWRESQGFFPVHHLLICLLRGLRTERWVACNKKEPGAFTSQSVEYEIILLNRILYAFNDLVMSFPP